MYGEFPDFGIISNSNQYECKSFEDQTKNDEFSAWILAEIDNHLKINECITPSESWNYLTNDADSYQSYSSQQSLTQSLSESISDESECSELIVCRKPGRPKSLGTKSYVKKAAKLWEFLRNLLLDEKTCPSLIKWDNYNEGTFKFVQSEKVAQLWGNRKNNTKMNYEKLSRAMRYYYRSQVLLPVAGKRLVYKFGPQATGWRTNNPILG